MKPYSVIMPDAIKRGMITPILGKSYPVGCPIPLEDLELIVTPLFWNGETRQGKLVMHTLVAAEVKDALWEIYLSNFPIERMIPIDYYGADDLRSMRANNSSGWCMRLKTGRERLPVLTASDFSEHGFAAIDLNTRLNPYVNGIVLPENGVRYVDRSLNRPGMIHKGDACYNAFVSRGWISGIDFESLKDYQHVEKDIRLALAQRYGWSITDGAVVVPFKPERLRSRAA